MIATVVDTLMEALILIFRTFCYHASVWPFNVNHPYT